jgi:cysteine desulfurase
MERLTALRERFWEGVSDLGGIRVNGHRQQRLPGAINLAVEGVDGETLLMSLKDLALSTGSACTSASLEPSYVLRAIGLPDELAHSSLRFSFGRFTSAEDVDLAVTQVRHAVRSLRARPSDTG